MALPDWVQGSLRPSLLITWNDIDDLTNATLTGYIRRKGTGTATPIAGTLTVTDGPNGVFRWDFAAGDVAQSGNFRVQFIAAFGSGQTPAKTFATDWNITGSLS